MAKDSNKTRTVSYTYVTLPPLKEAEIANRRASAPQPGIEIDRHPVPKIDLSHVPKMVDEEWKKPERGHLYRPVKRQITARVDADVLEWLKSKGKGYQSRINAILRREMLAAHRSAATE
jgi:uncharacterized protein (DUF4415 family)